MVLRPMLYTCIIITSMYYITFRRIIDKQNRPSTVGINWVLLELQAMLSNSYTSALKDCNPFAQCFKI